MVIPSVAELSRLPIARLGSMARAADELFVLLQEMQADGAHPVADLLAAAEGAFTTFVHYPANGIGGAGDKYAWYYHAHDLCAERAWLENGHFHCFAFVEDVAAGATPWVTPAQPRPDGRCAAHLIALCVNGDGVPDRLFTLNRWASDETLYPAETIVPLVDGFEIGEDRRFKATSRWLSLMLRLLQPQIAALLHRRDQVLRAAQSADPSGFSEDPSIEIASMLAFDLEEHLAALERVGLRRV